MSRTTQRGIALKSTAILYDDRHRYSNVVILKSTDQVNGIVVGQLFYLYYLYLCQWFTYV